MKHDSDPIRLLSESDVPGDLRLGLTRMQGALPSAAQIEALAAKLGVSSAPTAPMLLGKAAPLLKIAGGLGLLAAAAFGVVKFDAGTPAAQPERRAEPVAFTRSSASAPANQDFSRRSEKPRPRPAPAPLEAGSERASGLEPVPSENAPGTPVIERQVKSSTAPVSNDSRKAERLAGSSARTQLPAPAGTVASAANPVRGSAVRQSETELLADARAALDRSPGLALTLTEQHRREFPSGAFAQERELIALTALTRLGRGDDARARAERFRRNYPSSAYMRQVDRLVPHE
jgi:hypothetical protein